MKTNLERFFSSFVTTIVLLLIYAFGLAVATFIEKYHGTAAAKAMVYYSPLFFLLQFLLVVNFIAATIKHQYLKRGKWGDRKSTRLNSSHVSESRMPSSA